MDEKKRIQENGEIILRAITERFRQEKEKAVKESLKEKIQALKKIIQQGGEGKEEEWEKVGRISFIPYVGVQIFPPTKK